tara:strand:+ start:91 stop:426 length:336 start_codon:yes stop_codon:yes gene_type:complete
MVDKVQKIRELRKQIEEKNAEMNKLAEQLEYATTIQDIWPEAFANMSKCSLKGQAKKVNDNTRGSEYWENQYTLAWLERSDGEKYILSKEELLRLKGKHKIHKDYEDKVND